MKIKKRIFRIAFIAVLLIMAWSSAGCISVDHENRTTFELRRDGTVSQVIVDDADYGITGEELENYITESIAAFQNENSGESIALEKCRVGSGKINITLIYSSVAAYSAFNNVKCFDGTIKEAYNAGYDFNRSFYSMNGTSIPYFELPKYCQGCRVLIIEEPVDVLLPGELYIVTAGITIESGGGITVDKKTDDSYSQDVQVTTPEPAFLIYTPQE
jgi:hypothetical protein